MKSYTVIGLGRFGSRVALRLGALGEEVLAIDLSEDSVDRLAEHVTRAVCADAKSKETLSRLGVQSCDCAIVAVGSDLASSVLVTMNLKSLGVPKIICKAHDDTHREILEKLGADEVIIPERVVADRLAVSLTSSNVLDYIELSGDYGIVERVTPDAWCGKTIRELDIRAKLGLNLIAVKSGDSVCVSPAASYLLRKGETLVLLGEYAALRRLDRLK